MTAGPQKEGSSLQIRDTGEFPLCISMAVAKETTFASISLWDGLVDIYAIFLLLKQKRSTICGVFCHRDPLTRPFSTTIIASTDQSW